MAESIEQLNKIIKQSKQQNEYLESKISEFQMPGKTKLYYSLNRNMNDLADMLNSIKLKELNLEDPKDKTFERMKIIWASVSPLVETIRVLGESSGVTGDEDKDTSKKVSFLDKNAK
jgi:hypothetical protein